MPPVSGIFFDSNVLLYTLVRDDPRATVAANLLLDGGTISVQVLNEVANVARCKLKLSWAEVSETLAALRVLCAAPRPLTVTVHAAALPLAERYQLSFYDALIVASALDAGCDSLLSEDMHHGLVVADRLTVQNPFRGL